MFSSRVFPNSCIRKTKFILKGLDPRLSGLMIANRPSYKNIKDNIQEVRPIINEKVLKHLTNEFLISKVKANEQFFYEQLVETDIDYTKEASPHIYSHFKLTNKLLDSRKSSSDYRLFYLSIIKDE